MLTLCSQLYLDEMISALDDDVYRAVSVSLWRGHVVLLRANIRSPIHANAIAHEFNFARTYCHDPAASNVLHLSEPHVWLANELVDHALEALVSLRHLSLALEYGTNHRAEPHVDTCQRVRSDGPLAAKVVRVVERLAHSARVNL